MEKETLSANEDFFVLEFPGFMEKTVVHERDLLEKWGTHRGLMAEGRPKGSAERKGKAGLLEAGKDNN